MKKITFLYKYLILRIGSIFALLVIFSQISANILSTFVNLSLIFCLPKPYIVILIPQKDDSQIIY